MTGKFETDISDEESRMIMTAWVQEALESMNKECEKDDDSMQESVVHLLTAIRHYCDHHDLDFDDLNKWAATEFNMNKLEKPNA